MGLFGPLLGGRFRRLFFGMTLSRAGDAMSLVALIWVTLQNFGPALVGLVLLVSALPTLAAAPFAGVVVDRLGIRRAVVLDNSIRCLAAAVLAGVLWTGATSVPVLLGYAVLAGLTGPITEVAVDTATPGVVADEELDCANILLSTVWDLADLTGPVAAGLLIDAFGVPVVFAIDAITFLGMAVLVPDAPGSAAATAGSTTKRGLGRGFRLLFTSYRAALWLTLISVFMLAVAGAQEVIYPVLVNERLGAGATAYGLFVSICGAASLLGTLLLAPHATRWAPHHALAVTIALRGILLVPLGLTRSYPIAASSAAASTLADGPFYPLCRTVQQRLVPLQDRARVTGARSAFNVLGYPLGNALGGLLVANLSTSTILICLATLHLVPIVALLTIPTMRALPRRTRT